MIDVEINENIIYSNLIFNSPVKYSENITIYPVRMENIFDFQQFVQSITVRKDSIFSLKQILKMSYLDFLFYCSNNQELAQEYSLELLPYWYVYAWHLLKLVCIDQEILISETEGAFQINGELITPEKFDDIRKIIIIQNKVNFNIDEFMNYDTEKRLKEAQNIISKQNKEKATIEDYIDSLVISLKLTDEDIKQLTIRKFWRYIDRINMHDDYTIQKTGEMSGMVTFKEPIKHWMNSIQKVNEFENAKMNEEEIRSKVE